MLEASSPTDTGVSNRLFASVLHVFCRSETGPNLVKTDPNRAEPNLVQNWLWTKLDSRFGFAQFGLVYGPVLFKTVVHYEPTTDSSAFDFDWTELVGFVRKVGPFRLNRNSGDACYNIDKKQPAGKQ